MDSHRRMALFFFILMLILGITLERMLYSSGEVALIDKAEITLLEAVEHELNTQYSALGLYEAGIKTSPDKKYEHCGVISAEGKKVRDLVIDNNKILVASDIDSKIHHTILARKGINADSLLTCWSKQLNEAHIASRHALQIHVHVNGGTTLVCGDSTMLIPKYKKLSPIFAGLDNEIEVEPFICYTWFTVIANASIGIIVIVELAILLFLFICFVYYLRKKMKGYITSFEDKIDATIKLANLRYDYNSHELYVDERKIQIRAQSSSLLLLFLKAPTHSITKEEIISSLWRPEDDGVQDRLRRAISDLRKIFRDESVKISIEHTVNGYRLSV